MLIAHVLAGLAVLAPQGAKSATAVETITKEQAEARLANCGSRKFESVAEFPVDGKTKRSRLGLCAADSETHAEWIAKLEKAEASVKAQTRLPESARFKLLSDLRSEIDRLKSSQSTAAVVGDPAPAPAPKPPLVETDTQFAVSALPPLPAPEKTAAKASGPGSAPLTKKPRLSVLCASPGGAPTRCSNLFMDDAIVIRAEEDLASTLTVRFRRVDSDQQGAVRVAQLRRGNSVTLRVPPAVCNGVVRADFDVLVSGPGSDGRRYSDRHGPFSKRC